MSRADRRLYLRLLQKDFPTFLHRCFRELHGGATLDHNWHLDLIASALVSAGLGRTRRLIINVPPRHLKSLAVSVAYVAFYLGHFPDRHVICVSYGQDLADKLAADTRRIMESDWYREIFDTRIDQRRVHDFTTTAGGSRKATSFGGSLTGRGADLIIIDDGQKPDDAFTEAGRASVNESYSRTLASRLNDKATGVIIIVMQRLHQDDLCGHVLALEPWTQIRLPAIAVEDECFMVETIAGPRTVGRKRGEALHPARESLEVLAGIRARMGSLHFEAQYQQEPMPESGNLVKREWLRFYDGAALPRFSLVVQSWDTAIKAGDTNDYSVCITFGVFKQQYYVLDVFRRRLEYPELKREVKAHADRFRPTTILIEDKGSGTQLLQEARGMGLWNAKPYAPAAGLDKRSRMQCQTVRIENGQLLLPQSAPWLADYVRELTGFPSTKHDDQVDATSQALDFLNGKGTTLALWAKLGGG